ncbi:MAG TPA: cytidylate kinase-like family protein [Bacteroidales bacterium]
MANLLLNYMNQRLAERSLARESDPGPVITISRECGCGARNIAKELVLHLSRKAILTGSKTEWRWIDKEILEQSASKLNLEPSLVKRVLTDKERGTMDEILSALSSRSFKTDKKIRNTTFDVIRAFALAGHVIIIGRGGVVASRDIRRSLHVRFEAPEEWRIEAMMRLRPYTHLEAKLYIREQNEMRNRFRDKVLCDKSCNLLYDIIINRSRFSEPEIIQLIMQMAEAKGIC